MAASIASRICLGTVAPANQTVFLTRDEAEAALAEVLGDEPEPARRLQAQHEQGRHQPSRLRNPALACSLPSRYLIYNEDAARTSCVKCEPKLCGVPVLMHDLTGESLGRWHLPAPVEPGDLAADESGPPWRVVSVVEVEPSGPNGVNALAMCAPADEN